MNIEELEEMRDIINKRIAEIDRILIKRGITKKMVDKQWGEWLKYCEINNLDEFTGISKEEEVLI
ncbi:hypothetical protein ES705_47514 [subsurface metagenome]